jgi:adenine-specific DNA-methyltransferase
VTNQPQGRLELTWANKELRLLAHADETYEWVDPTDWRVAETRLLREIATIGEPSDNLLVCGDALHTLRALARIPGLRDRYQGKVRPCYIDPPFNTGQAFAQYDDALENSVWLTMLRDRLIQIREMLAANGSVWVHLDDAQQHRGRMVLDEVMGPENFVSTIAWQKADSPRMDAQQFSFSHDYIHVYSRTLGWRPNRTVVKIDPAKFPYEMSDGTRYSTSPLRKWGTNSRREDRPNLWYPITAPADIDHPDAGREVWPIRGDGSEGNWRWKRERVADNPDKIAWQDKGSGLQPYVITIAGNPRPRPPETWWPNDEVGHNREAKAHLKRLFGRDPFATPKPERLLARIIEISTEPGDLVLDCFVGSGTTAAVAHKMGRQWVASELLSDTITRFARPRLEHVVAGTDTGGVTKAFRWRGGGGFTVAEVAPSMFEDVGGVIVLAEWATGGALPEAVAAQVGYRLEADPPFAGRRGRSRLAVIDGVLSEDVARLLVERLDDRETVLVVAQAIEEGVSDLVRTLRPGSRVRKMPRDLARTSRFVGPIVTLGTTEPTGQTRMPV